MKKRRILALILALTILMSVANLVYARGAIQISCSMASVGSGKYKVSGIVQSGVTEDLTVYIYIYKVNGTQYEYITGFYSTGSGTYLKTEKTIPLSSGTYEIVVDGYGNTANGSASRTYVI